MDEPILLAIDGHNLAYRAFHAIRADLRAPDGRPTNALLGFVRTTEALFAALSPTHRCVVFDGGIPPHRKAWLPAYKANRPPMPDALREQFPLMDAWLDAARIPRIRLPDEEADDVLATLARQAEADGADVLLASSDRDLMTLVSDRVRLVTPTARPTIGGVQDVLRRTGVPPGQVLAWRALVGDPSDNIPGVRGVGPRTAARLLTCHGSLEQLWAHPEAIEPARIREAVVAARAEVERNVAVIRLNERVDGPLDWKACARAEPDPVALRHVLRDVGFTQRSAPSPDEPDLFS